MPRRKSLCPPHHKNNNISHCLSIYFFQLSLFVLFSPNQSHFFSLSFIFSPPHLPPLVTSSRAAGELKTADVGVGSVRWLIQSPVAVSAAPAAPSPPTSPRQLLPDPRAICLARAFSASDPIFQLVSLYNYMLILTDLT